MTSSLLTTSSCIFCEILAERAPAHMVWSDGDHVAFMDIRPVATGHVLLIPRTHVEWVEELTADAHARLFAAARRLAPAVARAADAPHAGYAVEGYGVPHAHLHLVPVRRAGDLDPCRQSSATHDELASAAEKVRVALAELPPS